MKPYKAMAHIHSLNGELREVGSYYKMLSLQRTFSKLKMAVIGL